MRQFFAKHPYFITSVIAGLLLFVFSSFNHIKLKTPQGYEVELDRLKQKEAIEKDKLDADYHGEQIKFSKLYTLKDVSLGNPTAADEKATVYLHFEETLEAKKMRLYQLERDIMKAEKAKKLIGKKVFTTVWNSDEEPNKYSENEWFNNIYEHDTQINNAAK